MDEALAQFISVTNASPDQARAYLEAANGDVSTALSTYFESGDATVSEVVDPAPAATTTPAPGDPRTLSGAPITDSAPWPSSSSSKSTGRPARPAKRSGGIMTFNDLRSGQAQSHDDDDDPMNLFAGGERSGINVENPDSQRGGTGHALVDDILSKAATSSQAASAHAVGTKTTPSAFSGKGYSIGGATVGNDTAQDTRPSASSSFFGSMPGAAPLNGGMGEDETDEEPVIRHLTFWQDGFSIEDGPLMRYDDPANQETLQAINSGRAPLSLLNVRFGQPVELMVARRTHEKYVPPPPPPTKPFDGTGVRLGAPSAEPTPAPKPAATPASTASTDVLHVDSSQPTTQVQVRLTDGQRLVAKLNHTHTVADLRRYIEAYVSYATILTYFSQRPDLAGQNFTIRTSFPPKPITDETLTVADAGLLNAVVVLR